MITLKKCNKKSKTNDKVYLISNKEKFENFDFDENTKDFLKKNLKKNINLFSTFYDKATHWFVVFNEKEDLSKQARKLAFSLTKKLNSNKTEKIELFNKVLDTNVLKKFLEAQILSNYQFLKYKTKDVEKIKNSLETIKVFDKNIQDKDLEEIKIITEAIYLARDLGNTPYADLNSVDLANKIKELGKTTELQIEVLDKKQIESLNMGGLLAVNKGSKYPPTFSIITHKPKNSVNSQPIIFVGKGIVFDSGGTNLKPSGYIEDMKYDMLGAATVIGIMYALSKLKLPVYAIGIVPSTDNMLSNASYVPGDVLKMHNGKTVEVKNTDAEGRLILADALSYSKKFNPQLVIDLATLTGSAILCFSNKAIAMFAKTKNKTKQTLIEAGEEVGEKLIELPLWEEYGECLKSDIADIKNLGNKYAGVITAAKFLEFFTEGYDWIHLDIATNAFVDNELGYLGKGATGTGIRLLINFVNKFFANPKK